MSETLERLVERARAWWQQATPAERSAMKKAQRESFIRAMTTPCEHGVLDFEQCPDCIAEARGRISQSSHQEKGEV